MKTNQRKIKKIKKHNKMTVKKGVIVFINRPLPSQYQKFQYYVPHAVTNILMLNDPHATERFLISNIYEKFPYMIKNLAIRFQLMYSSWEDLHKAPCPSVFMFLYAYWIPTDNANLPKDAFAVNLELDNNILKASTKYFRYTLNLNDTVLISVNLRSEIPLGCVHGKINSQCDICNRQFFTLEYTRSSTYLYPLGCDIKNADIIMRSKNMIYTEIPEKEVLCTKFLTNSTDYTEITRFIEKKGKVVCIQVKKLPDFFQSTFEKFGQKKSLIYAYHYKNLTKSRYYEETEEKETEETEETEKDNKEKKTQKIHEEITKQTAEKNIAKTLSDFCDVKENKNNLKLLNPKKTRDYVCDEINKIQDMICAEEIYHIGFDTLKNWGFNFE